jgi:ADP-L-glycero-D-manno-heptose 6-epimerase
MYIVTGGAGMIGSALLWELNNLGLDEILVVDNLASTEKWRNLLKRRYLAYMHRDSFLQCLKEDRLEEALEREGRLGRGPGRIQGIAHLGACSSTTEKDADFLLRNNVEYSKIVCAYALARNIRFIQASSAATYGDGSRGFDDDPEGLENLRPLNMYGYSKHLFDLWARRTGRLEHLACVKFFNVYGPNEYHKGEMRSVAQKAVEQIEERGSVGLFRSCRRDYADGGQLRDFVYVKDCARILAILLRSPDINGLFNLGSGRARSWNELAAAVFAALGKEKRIEYIDMPEALRRKYQYFTEARTERLRLALAGRADFQPHSLEEGVSDYVQNYLTGEDRYL